MQQAFNDPLWRTVLSGAQMLFVAFGALVLMPLITGLDPNVALFTAGLGTILFQIATAKAEGPAVDRKQTTTSLAYVYAYNSELDFYVIGSDDRIRGQTNGLSAAIGVRYRHQ